MPDVATRAYDTAPRPFGVVKQRCTWCGETKPVGEFARNAETGWITRECRSCEAERLQCWATVDRAPAIVGKRYVDEAATDLLCARCGRERPKSAFYTYKDGRSDRRYYRPKCKQCMGAEQNTNGNRSRYRSTDRDRDRWLRKQYGIGLGDYIQILAEQGGRCAICRTDEPGGPTPNSAFHVDHDHKSGRVRGLLCRACNTAIGAMGDDPERLMAAVAYLLSSGEAP